jgi:glycerol-3-phosphate acyltransferase PlsY
VLIDLLRLFSKHVDLFAFDKLAFFFKEKERHAFSSATQFLVAIFLTVLLFSRPIATTAIIFITFADIAAKFTGIEHGKTKIFDKTLVGSSAFLAAALVLGIAWSRIVPVPIELIIWGALAATLTELLPIGVSDNFAIPLIGAAVMRLAQIF